MKDRLIPATWATLSNLPLMRRGRHATGASGGAGPSALRARWEGGHRGARVRHTSSARSDGRPQLPPGSDRRKARRRRDAPRPSRGPADGSSGSGSCSRWPLASCVPSCRRSISRRLSRSPNHGPWGQTSEAELNTLVEILEQKRQRLVPTHADVARDELRQAAGLARHSAWRLGQRLLQKGPSAQVLDRDLASLSDEQARVWRARRRPGGLRDSLACLQRALPDD